MLSPFHAVFYSFVLCSCYRDHFTLSHMLQLSTQQHFDYVFRFSVELALFEEYRVHAKFINIIVKQ
jgi:hypothetical protein